MSVEYRAPFLLLHASQGRLDFFFGAGEMRTPLSPMASDVGEIIRILLGEQPFRSG